MLTAMLYFETLEAAVKLMSPPFLIGHFALAPECTFEEAIYERDYVLFFFSFRAICSHFAALPRMKPLKTLACDANINHIMLCPCFVNGHSESGGRGTLNVSL